MNEDYFHYFIVITSVLLIFGPSIRNDFVFDDHEALVKNRDLIFNSNDSIFKLDLLKHDFWGNEIKDNSSHKSYRPLTVIVYRLIVKCSSLWIKNSNQSSIKPLIPYYFHSCNLFIYCFTCCYIYHTLKIAFSSELISLLPGKLTDISFKSTILFSLHPLHCEPVSSCVGLADLLSAICSWIALNYFFKNIEIIWEPGKIWKHFTVVLQTIFFSVASMFFKEQGITTLGFIVFLIILKSYLKDQNEEVSYLKLSITILGYLIVIIALLYLRIWIMGFNLPKFNKMDNPSAQIEDKLLRYINYSYIYLLNIFIIICPIWLSFDWSMGCVPIIESFSDFRFSLVMFFWFSLFLFVAKILMLKAKYLRNILVIFSMYSIIIFLPASNLFFPVGFVIAERNLFSPVLGFCVIFVVCQQYLLHQSSFWKYRKVLKFGFHFVIVLLALRSFLRNLDWNNESILYEKDSLVCPGNAKIFYNIGKVSADHGNKTKAVEYYRKSITLYENYTNALNNLGNILKNENLLNEAKLLLERACSSDPKFSIGWMNLGTVEMSLNNLDKSEFCFLKSIQLRPDHANTFFNLGNLYLKKKRFQQAEESFRKAIELDNKFTKAWHNLILLKQNLKHADEAYSIALEALNFNPFEHSLHFLMGNILGQQSSKFSKAEYHFKTALNLDPTNAKYSNNLAVLYHRKEKYSLAIEYYKKTIELDPEHGNARKNLQKILKHDF